MYVVAIHTSTTKAFFSLYEIQTDKVVHIKQVLCVTSIYLQNTSPMVSHTKIIQGLLKVM